MTSHRYLVAKSDWHAKQVLKKIRQGRIEPEKVPLVLMESQEIARKRIKAMPFGSQELYSVYRVNHGADEVARIVETAPPSGWKRIFIG